MDIRTTIIDWLAAKTGMPAGQIDEWLEVPPQPSLGDYAFPCFRLAKELRRAPAQIAGELQQQNVAMIPSLDRLEAVGGYLNFFIKRSDFISQTVADVLKAGDKLGASDEGSGKTVLVEYSSPNIAKPFHVGHAFTTVLGHALYRLYDHLGYNTIRLNHLGDYGTQFGKLIVAYRRWGKEDELQKEPIRELLRIYVLFHEKAKNQPELEQEAREAFRLLESGGQEETELWQRFRDLSLQTFSALYERLGVSFDNYNGESFYTDQIPAVIDLLRQKSLLRESDGALVVDLDEYNLPPCIILKSDGTTIYASRDIAAVLYRDRTWKFDKNIYVVGLPQETHFRQVFAVLDKAGIEAAGKCTHVGFGLVRFPDRKLSTRSGDVIMLENLLDESVEKTLEIIRQNMALRQDSSTEEEMRAIAEKIGIGAVVYTFLKNGRERDITFSWEEMLDFDGDTAPYVQYTYARARSILRKAEARGISTDLDSACLALLGSEDEFAISRLLDDFPHTIKRAVAAHEPYMVVRLVTALARAFNKYYNQESILGTGDDKLRLARLNLVAAVCRVIRTGLDLAGIQVVERM